MPINKLSEGICFNNMKINSINSSSGIFTGRNTQFFWASQRRTQAGFGTVAGTENALDNPCCVVTDPGSSDEMLEYFKKIAEKRLGG